MDARALQGSHLAIIGNSGSGKSYAIRRLLEDSWGQATHIVFDVEDEFHSLTAGFPYVLVGGEYAQVPLRLSEAAALAQRVVREGVSVIIQLNGQTMLDRQRYIARFLEGLLALPRPDWRRCLVVIDEADKYAPQGAQAESLRPIVNFMAMGRKRGFVGVLATQRAAKIAKSAVSECSNWMIGRQVGVNDRRVACEVLGFRQTDAEMRDLPSLAPGRFWRTGPAFEGRVLASVPRARTRHLGFGDHFTPAPAPELAARLRPRAAAPPAGPAPIPAARRDRSGWATLVAVVIAAGVGFCAVKLGITLRL